MPKRQQKMTINKILYLKMNDFSDLIRQARVANRLKSLLCADYEKQILPYEKTHKRYIHA
jgi:hypothetical protein